MGIYYSNHMESQISSNLTIYPTACSDQHQEKLKPNYWLFITNGFPSQISSNAENISSPVILLPISGAVVCSLILKVTFHLIRYHQLYNKMASEV